jgi:hypothetical protein
MTFLTPASSRSFGGSGGFFTRGGGGGGLQYGGRFFGMMMRRGLTSSVGRRAQQKLLNTAVSKTAKSASKTAKKSKKIAFKKKVGRVGKKSKKTTFGKKKQQAQLAIKGPNRKAILGPKNYPVAVRPNNYPVAVYKPTNKTLVSGTAGVGKAWRGKSSWRQRFKMGPAMKRKIRNALITGAISGTAGAGMEIGMMYAFHRAMGHANPTANDMKKVAADAGSQLAARAASGEKVTPSMVVDEGKKAFKRQLAEIKGHGKSKSKDPVSLTKKKVAQILQDAAKMQLRTNLNARVKYLQLYRTNSRGQRRNKLYEPRMYGTGSGKSGKKKKKGSKKKKRRRRRRARRRRRSLQGVARKRL